MNLSQLDALKSNDSKNWRQWLAVSCTVHASGGWGVGGSRIRPVVWAERSSFSPLWFFLN